MTDLDPTTRLIHSPRSASRVLEGRAVVVVIDAQRVHTLNGVGTRVWQLAEGRTVGEVADALTQEFEVDREQALADVMAFATELVSLGALERA